MLNHPNALHNETLTWDNPGYEVIFFIVDANGEDFRYLNKLETRHEFFWDRWKPFKKDLVPFSIHCFLMRVYQAKTGVTGNGFWPEARVCGFDNLDQARIVNKAFLDTWQLYNDHASAQDTRNITFAFIDRLKQWDTVRAQARQTVIDATAVLFDPVTASMLAEANNGTDFNLDLEEDFDDFFLDAQIAIAELAEGYITPDQYLKSLGDQVDYSITKDAVV